MGKKIDVGKKGVHFQDLVRKIERYYKKRGIPKSAKRKGYRTARELARATAGKMFWKKFGKRKGRKIIKRAKRVR